MDRRDPASASSGRIRNLSDAGGTRAVVLAGGRGTRLAPYTTVLPKPLMPVGDMPILEILVRQLHRAGIRRITLAVGHLAALLEAYFGDGARFGVSLDYSYEDEPVGTAGPLALVGGLDQTFLVMNGDLLTTIDFEELLRTHRARGAMVTVGLFEKEVQLGLGIVESDPSGRVTNYVEKPTLTYDVSVGIYAMEPAALEHIEPGERLDLPDLVLRLIAAGADVHAYRFSGTWFDIGRPDDYAAASEHFERQRDELLPDGD
jgi:NDP-sugar pyrophosphorylase family protein